MAIPFFADKPGTIYDALSLVIAVESESPEESAAAALLCGLEGPEVTALMREALDWALNVVSAGE